MTKTKCIALCLGRQFFDITVKDKLKKEQEEKGKFVYTNLPSLKDNFTLYSVIQNAHLLFKDKKFLKGHWIISEGFISDKIYLIKRGECAIYKNLERKNEYG